MNEFHHVNMVVSIIIFVLIICFLIYVIIASRKIFREWNKNIEAQSKKWKSIVAKWEAEDKKS